jgi:Tol biopolymer transport system component
VRALGALCLLVCLSSGASALPGQTPGTLAVAGSKGLFLVDENGKNLRPLTHGYAQEPVWSPDGRAVAFLSSQGLAIKSLAGATQVIRRPDRLRFARSLSWSPDGKRLAYVGERKVVILSRDGRSSRTLLQVPKGCSHIPPQMAAWAPDGQQIAIARGCVSTRGPLQGIWLHDLRGGPARQLVRTARAPSWSPSGKQLAFERNCVIWIVEIATRQERRVADSSCAWFINRVTWSPDEQSLAYDTYAPRCNGYGRPPTTVTILRLDTGAERDLRLPCAGRFSQPSWQPK